MSVVTYKLSQGDRPLTKHLRLSEFRTPGVDTILLDDDLAPTIERIRDGITDRWGIKVSATIINSGYRTPGANGYDRKVGGSGSGPHTTGKAADFYFRDENGKAIPSIYGLCAAQLLGLKGIERIMDGVSIHIDINYRANYWWAYQSKNANGAYVYHTLSDFFTTDWAINVPVLPPKAATPTITGKESVTLIRRGSSGGIVRIWQQILQLNGYYKGAIDGQFGAGTDAATRKIQTFKGLAADGYVGKATWAAFGYVCK